MKTKIIVPKPAPRTYYVRDNILCVNFMRIDTDALKLPPVYPVRYPNPFKGVS